MKNFRNAISILWKTSKMYFILILVLSVSASVPEIINLLVWKKILDMAAGFLMEDTINYQLIIFYVLLHFILKMLGDILNRFNEYNKTIYSRKIEKYVTNETIDAIGMMQLMDMENSEMHNTIEKAAEESSAKLMGLLSNSVDLIQNFTIFSGMSGILISFSFKIYIIIFISIVPMALYSKKYFNKLFDVYNKRFEKLRYSNELRSMISRSEIFKEIKVFNSLSYIKTKINEILDEVISDDKKTQKELNLKGVLSGVVETFFTYILKLIIIVMGIATKSTIGTINMNMESASRLQGTTSNVIFIFISMYEDCLYLSSFTELQEYKNKIIHEEKARKCKTINDFSIKSIEFVNVWFRYTEQNDYVIKNLSFKFEEGKTYAIVGFNGGGKTTLIKILMRLYVPQKGEILINGVNIENYDVNTYWKQISAVFQDFVKYPFTVRENIGIGNIEDMDDLKKIQHSAAVSYADSFISKLTGGYEEKLVRGWENSTDISIGQWQRLAIARSAMREGNMIIFDEPSAALDARTENHIFTKVMYAQKGKIGIIVTHRFLNIKKADEIIVLKDGFLESHGTHDDLLDTNETYTELYNAQKEMI